MKILHLVRDDKFLDEMLPFWDSFSKIESLYVLIQRKSYQTRWIKSRERLMICHNKLEFMQLISDVDAIYIHALTADKYNFVKLVPKGIKVILWAWGDDIYESKFSLKPILPLKLYKEETLRWVNSISDDWKKRIKTIMHYCFRCYYSSLQQKVLERLDYIQTVLPIEYDLLKQKYGFSAKPLINRMVYHYNTEEISTGKGYILLGNSATCTNNHIDVLKKLYFARNRTIIIPLNYGDMNYKEFVKSNDVLSDFSDIRILDSFLPLGEYKEIINSCSIAIFGMIRQQAIGNVIICLFKGLKVFLYKDSIIYKSLIRDGFLVYTIEDDLNLNGVDNPLTDSQIMHNRGLVNKDYSSYEDAVRYFENELLKTIQ